MVTLPSEKTPPTSTIAMLNFTEAVIGNFVKMKRYQHVEKYHILLSQSNLYCELLC